MAGLLVLSCGEKVGLESERTGQLALIPVFQSAGGGIVPVSALRVFLLRSDSSTVALDTTLALQSDQDSVDVTFDVQLFGPTENFFLELELTDAAGSVVFKSGPDVVTISSSGDAPEPTPVELEYVGIGADAVAVNITTTNPVVEVSGTLTLQAVALDNQGEAIEGTPIRWTSTAPALGDFPANDVGTMVAASTRGSVSVVAELLTGPADTTSVLILPPPDELTAEAIDSLEAALFAAVNDVLENDNAEISDLDRFSFEPARERFDQAFTLDPDNETAAFGLGVTTILSLEDDAELRGLLESWEQWLDSFGIDELFMDLASFPPTLAAHQDFLRNSVEPALQEALAALNTVSSPDFVFVVTPEMRGDLPADADPLELDLTEVFGLRAGMEAALAAIDIALAYQTMPSPYGITGLGAALELMSTFATLASDGQTRLADAQQRILRAVDLVGQGLDFLEAEIDDQSNDVLKYYPAAPSGWEQLEDSIGTADIQDIRDALADIDGISRGPFTVSEDFGKGEVDLVVDASRFFLNPVQDLKDLLPEYQVTDGEFHWTALYFDAWTIPDPTLNGILPDMTSSDELKATIDLYDVWEDAALDTDKWVALAQSPEDGDLFAVSEAGSLREISSDFSSDVDRPDILDGNVTTIAANVEMSELWALTYEGVVFTRPDDDATPWTQALTLPIYGCCWTHLIEGPGGGNMFAMTEFGDLYEIAADLSPIDRPDVPYSVVGLASNPQAFELLALTYDGVVYSRPADETSEWTEQFRLPYDGNYYWQSITLSPLDTDLFAIREDGLVYEIASDYSSSIDRPDVPASNIAALTINLGTLELLAVTEDGRVFSRPDDDSSPWTLQITLPLVVVQ